MFASLILAASLLAQAPTPVHFVSSPPRSSAHAARAPRSTSRSYRGSVSKSRGYYRGPSQPSGNFTSGLGSSHKGGHYQNYNTGNRYQKQPR